MLHLQTRLYRTPRAHQYHCHVNIILIACYSSKSHLHKAKCINLLMAPYFKDSLSKEIPFIYKFIFWAKHVLFVTDFLYLQLLKFLTLTKVFSSV